MPVLRTLGLAMANRMVDHPFLRLQHVRGGEEIIKRIIRLGVQTVDIFVTSLPPSPLPHRYATRVGPSLHWLRAHGYTVDGDGDGPGLSSKGEETMTFPSWYLVRLETKMRTVCRGWKQIVDTEIVRKFSKRMNTKPNP